MECNVPFAFAVLLAAASVSGQAPQAPVDQSPATAIIVGRVVDAASGHPIAGAIVTLQGAGPGLQPRALVSPSGQFIFRALRKGFYGLLAQRPGYAPASYGQMRPEGSSLSVRVADGQRLTDVTIRMWQYGPIGGTVTDEAGEPLVDVRVTAFIQTFVAGHRRIGSNGFATTDDRGQGIPASALWVVPNGGHGPIFGAQASAFAAAALAHLSDSRPTRVA